MSSTRPALPRRRAILKARKARPFYGRHPWVLDRAIDHVEGEPADGDIIDLVADNGKFVARGIFNSASRIRVRLYTWTPAEALDEAFWQRRLERAIDFRQQLGYDAADAAARLVFSEADGLSGLIVDRYAQWLSVQITARATAARLDLLTRLLIQQIQPQGIFCGPKKGWPRPRRSTCATDCIGGPPPRDRCSSPRMACATASTWPKGRRPGSISTSAKSPRGRHLPGRPARARSVLLLRWLRPECRRRRSERSRGIRFQPKGDRPGPGQRRP